MMTTGRKLALGGLVIAAATGYMAYLGARASWQYYLTADECMAHRSVLQDKRLRISGRIAAATLKIADDHRQADFALQGAAATLPVRYRGRLPENLNEQNELVVEGRFEGDCVMADKLITRCATKYRSEAQGPPDRMAQQPTGSPR